MNNYFRRKKAFLFCALLLFFVFIFCYEPPDTPAELRHLKDSLSWSNLTFEDYHLRREIYEDLRLLGPGGDPVERSMIIEEGGGARGLQTRIINALYTYYRGNAMPNNPLDNKQNYVIPRKTMICDALRNVNISIYKQGDPNFKKEFSNLFPSEPFLGGKRYQTCALVSNSGAVIGSGQGKFIDNHELVVRFNHAITNGYEKDVGSKTDLRILNSLLLKDNKYDFLNPEKTIYHSEKTIYIAFEKSERNMSFKSWSSAAYNYLDNYARKRRLHRNQKFYLLDYNSLWNMQDWLGSISKYPIANYIPSSGFIGLHLILRSCDVIRLFEFIPSQRDTDLCHYFERYSKPGCGYRGDHSFAAEKLAYYIMGNVAREEIFEGGYLTIDTQHC